MSGKIIVIEGTDCSGKETQTKKLFERLQKEGVKCKMFSFPNYDTPTGKIISGPLLGKDDEINSFFENPMELEPKVTCLYYAADRRYNMTKYIKKYLDEGYHIILDRYVTSNLAHQGSKIDDKDERFYMYEWIDKLEYWLLDLPKPTKTIFLHVPYDFVKELIKKRVHKDHAEKAGPEIIKKSINSYIELSSLYNWDRIECIKDNNLRSIDDIHNEIYDMVKKEIDKID